MTETEATPTAELVTPTKRFRIKLPSRSTVKKVGALTGAAALGAVVTARALKRNCACDSDTATEAGTADQSTD